MENKSVVYELKEKAIDFHIALDICGDAETAKRNFLEYLNSKTTQSYLLGLGKVCTGIGDVKANPAWEKFYLDMNQRLYKVLENMKKGLDSEIVKADLKENLLRLASTLGFIGAIEKSIDTAYTQQK